MTLKEHLTSEVANWEFIGHPALLQRFVLRNGKEYTPTNRIGRKGIPKQCFMNATKAVRRKWDYVEGFAIHRTDPLLAFHHAWVTTNGEDAMDPTLDVAEYEYFGVMFDRHTLLMEITRSRAYGLLDTGFGMNTRLMFELDPQLKAIVEAVKPSATWQRANQILEELKSCND